MWQRRRQATGATRWRLILSLLCIALVVFAGTLSVAHGHEDGVTHADCGLCLTAHVSVQVTTPILLGPGAPVFERVQVPLPAVRPRRLSRFALFTRPPPTSLLEAS